jgi:sec-independent protein translocase protein TatC
MSVTARAQTLSSVHVPSHPRTSAWRRLALELVAAAAAATEMMSFLEHLDELRKRLIWALVSVAIAFAVCWAFSGELYDLAAAPIRANPSVILSVSRPQDVFALSFKVTLVGALFLSAPFVLWQVWLFVSPGLYAHERRYAVPLVLTASIFFVLGGAFGYVVAFPAALKFLLDWTAALRLTPIIDASAYFDLFFAVVVSLGFVFQIPIAIFVLSRIGLVTARFLLVNLKYAIFAAAVVAAIITPTTDPGNMLIIAGPMVALYALGIPIAWMFGRKREAEAR